MQVTAVFAADAVARLSGCVGVAAVTAGPGLTNTVTAVKNAQMAESPVLLMGGAAATLLKVEIAAIDTHPDAVWSLELVASLNKPTIIIIIIIVDTHLQSHEPRDVLLLY